MALSHCIALSQSLGKSLPRLPRRLIREHLSHMVNLEHGESCTVPAEVLLLPAKTRDTALATDRFTIPQGLLVYCYTIQRAESIQYEYRVHCFAESHPQCRKAVEAGWYVVGMTMHQNILQVLCSPELPPAEQEHKATVTGKRNYTRQQTLQLQQGNELDVTGDTESTALLGLSVSVPDARVSQHQNGYLLQDRQYVAATRAWFAAQPGSSCDTGCTVTTRALKHDTRLHLSKLHGSGLGRSIMPPHPLPKSLRAQSSSAALEKQVAYVHITNEGPAVRGFKAACHLAGKPASNAESFQECKKVHWSDVRSGTITISTAPTSAAVLAASGSCSHPQQQHACTKLDKSYGCQHGPDNLGQHLLLLQQLQQLSTLTARQLQQLLQQLNTVHRSFVDSWECSSWSGQVGSCQGCCCSSSHILNQPTPFYKERSAVLCKFGVQPGAAGVFCVELQHVKVALEAAAEELQSGTPAQNDMLCGTPATCCKPVSHTDAFATLSESNPSTRIPFSSGPTTNLAHRQKKVCQRRLGPLYAFTSARRACTVEVPLSAAGDFDSAAATSDRDGSLTKSLQPDLPHHTLQQEREYCTFNGISAATYSHLLSSVTAAPDSDVKAHESSALAAALVAAAFQ